MSRLLNRGVPTVRAPVIPVADRIADRATS
jgi:hypothetical protein